MHIQFLGATQEVTGSCYLIKCAEFQILVECGLIQGSYKDEARNKESFKFDPKKIDAVILTHAHIDHSGRLPLLVKQGFTGPIYTHTATRDLCEVLLLDSAFLAERDAHTASKKRLRKNKEPVIPIYTHADVENTLPLFQPLEYAQKKEILQGIHMRLQDAGHILGAGILELWLIENGQQRKIVFSGDLGNSKIPILQDPMNIPQADLVIMESTYGDRLHEEYKESLAALGKAIKAAQQDKGNILIPAFAVGRTQEILYFFQTHFKEWNLETMEIFLDSPMAIRATEIYEKHWRLYNQSAKTSVLKHGSLYKLKNLHITKETNESMRINNVVAGAIIIAGSGMCNGGRIQHHLKYNLWRKNCHVIFVGYQAQSTLGRTLIDGAQEVMLWGDPVKVKAQIHSITGFSAHADKKQLLDWYGHFQNHPPVFLIHGEPNAMTGLTQALYDRYTVHAFSPKVDQVIDLLDLKALKKLRHPSP